MDFTDCWLSYSLRHTDTYRKNQCMGFPNHPFPNIGPCCISYHTACAGIPGENEMTCLNCKYFSMWDGVCMNPTSSNLWFSCFDIRKGDYKDACEDFEKEENEDEY